MTDITDILKSTFHFITTLFHTKDWRGIGFDKENGTFIIVPDRNIMKIYTYIKNSKGYFSLTQGNGGNKEEVFFQFHFKSIEEIEMFTNQLFKLRMDLVIEKLKSEMDTNTYEDYIDDLNYDHIDVFPEYDNKHKYDVCAYHTETGCIARFKTLAGLANLLQIPTKQVSDILNSGILCEIKDGYQIRYAVDTHTFISKEKIKMVNHTYVANEGDVKIINALQLKKKKLEEKELAK